jgi:plastocyanin
MRAVILAPEALVETRILVKSIVAAAALSLVAACGGGGGGGSTPTAPSGGGGGGAPGPSGATITIGSNGAVSPSQVTITVGQSVTFVNNDSRGHEIASNPHPVHTDCPPMSAAGNISPGQTKLTNAFTTARTCGFHDHSNPENAALQGNVVIQ